ncbi:hypothetical protein [Hymenobacter terricola]|uniref:hypothetical protein n=1 Tax=Hymenobacter terricola TaxID=2819236 RepID=UPI001B30E59D|nr:hypothetical protein [Hymenobacter terricola]
MAPDSSLPPTSPDRAPWPKNFATAQEVLTWLNSLKARDQLTGRCLLTMRWLVLDELERSAPEPPPKAVPAFTPNLFTQPLK